MEVILRMDIDSDYPIEAAQLMLACVIARECELFLEAGGISVTLKPNATGYEAA